MSYKNGFHWKREDGFGRYFLEKRCLMKRRKWFMERRSE